MIDFSGYRAMFLDFGIDPSIIGKMSLGEFSGMLVELRRRRSNTPDVPSDEERQNAMDVFLSHIASDPMVRVN